MWLALDTSGRTSTAAITDGDSIIAEVQVRRARMHSEQLITHLDTARRLAGGPPIDGIAVSAGPGSFTGLRIGLATAKSLAYVWQVPLVGVNSLTALLYNYREASTPLCAIVDAQKGNVYYSCGYWTDGTLHLTSDSRTAPFAQVAAQLQAQASQTIVLGDAVDIFAEEIAECPGLTAAPPHQRYVRAGAVGVLGQAEYLRRGTDDPMTLTPLYLRRSEAEVLWEKRQCRQ